MHLQTQVAQDIDATNGKTRLDKQIKTILANRAILAKILLNVMEEFNGYDMNFVMKCIDGDPLISSVSVMPGQTNTMPDKIQQLGTEELCQAKVLYIMISE